MEEDRWARKCIKEEIRNIRNSSPTNWGQSFKKAKENMGDGQIIQMIGEGKPLDIVAKKLVKLEMIAEAQEIKKDWTRIEQSSYCRYYKEMKEMTEMKTYWQKKKLKGRQKEVWARWRCGNAVREGKKGFKDTNFRACRNKEETLQHVIECEEIMNKLKAPKKEWWKSWREKRKTKDLRKKLLADLQKEVNEELCSKLSKIEKILNVND